MTGLEHHSSSILGRVIWGRSLLALGDLPGAQDQFEIAIALDPASPYAYNLVGEALYTKELFREALPVLARAVELQPADDRLRGWLEAARRRVQGGALPAAAGEEPETTRPHPLARPSTAVPAAAAPGAPPEPAPGRPHRAAAAAAARTPSMAGAPTPVPGPAPRAPARRVAAAAAPAPAPAPARPAPSAPRTAPPPVPPVPAPSVAAPPIPPALHRDEIPRSLLSDDPAAPRSPNVVAIPAPAPSPPDEQEADRITAEYERKVREQLLSQGEPTLSFHRRHRGAILAAVLLAGAVAAVWVFLHIRDRSQSEAAASAAAARACRPGPRHGRSAARGLPGAGGGAPPDLHARALLAGGPGGRRPRHRSRRRRGADPGPGAGRAARGRRRRARRGLPPGAHAGRAGRVRGGRPGRSALLGAAAPGAGRPHPRQAWRAGGREGPGGDRRPGHAAAPAGPIRPGRRRHGGRRSGGRARLLRCGALCARHPSPLGGGRGRGPAGAGSGPGPGPTPTWRVWRPIRAARRRSTCGSGTRSRAPGSSRRWAIP